MIFKPLLFGSIFMLFMQAAAAAPDKKVTFEITAKGLTDADSLYITGNHDKLGNWDPGKIVLDKISRNQWSITLFFKAGDHLEFKFTRGNWQSEALDKSGNIPPNTRLPVKQDTMFRAEINQWRDDFGRSGATEQGITGTVYYHRNIRAGGLPERDVVVWLPPGYRENTGQRYPVLYMHDGQNLFDPAISFSGIDWQLDETADSLIRQNKIDPLIIVGIYNSPLRKKEYSHSDTGKIYINFVINTVKEMIDKNYRTLADREHTATGGSSRGALISFILSWTYPQIFSKAICMSGAFRIDSIDYVSTVKNSGESKKDIKIYFDNGGINLDAKLQTGIDAMIQALREKGYKENEDFFRYHDETADHNEAAWAKRVWRPLKLFYGKAHEIEK